MIRSFFIIAIRSIRRQKLYSVLNIIGLSGGITASLLLLLYINDELSYDHGHSKANQIYRVNTLAEIADTKISIANTMSPLGPALKNDYPEVLNFVRLNSFGETLITKDENRYYEEGFFIVDSSFFDFFDIELVRGDKKDALTAPNTIVLTEELAKKYFGEEDPIGQTLKTGAEEDLKTVTGVMKTPDFSTHIKPQLLVSYSTLPDLGPGAWGNVNDFLYIMLPEGHNYKDLEAKFPDVFDKYLRELFSQFDAKAEFTLTPFLDIHLKSRLEGEMEPGGTLAYIYIFTAIALFILLIASINYMNMSTARAITRSKEVGIRKVMGSYVGQLRWQFLTESVIITLISALLSGIIAILLLPSFNELAGKNIPVDFYSDPRIVLGFLIIIVFVGTISGSYPAFYLSRFKPVQVLKGKGLIGGGNAGLRKVLVVFQFSISLVMIVSTWVVYDQLNYMNSKDLGFNKDQVIQVSLSGSSVREKYDVLRNELLKSPNIEAVGSGQGTPGGKYLNVQGIGVESNTGDFIDEIFQAIYVDQNYLSTLEIPVTKGRDFLQDVGRDTIDGIIVNETMVKKMGWEDPIGKKFRLISDENEEREIKKVVGVIQDFHMRALQEPIEPLVIHMRLQGPQMLVRMNGSKFETAMDYVEETWKKVVTNRPLEYTVLSQEFAQQYEEDQRRGSIFAIFSGLTIFIACMGLFGLASYNSEMKKKEIGLRKVMGATLMDIMVLVGKDFLKLVFIAMLIAFPIAYYFMNNWLQDFSFRVELSVITFLLSALVTIVITVITISYHSIMAGFSNPIDSLKEE